MALTVTQVDHTDNPVWDVIDTATGKWWSVARIGGPTPLVVAASGRYVKATGRTGTRVVAAVRASLA